MSDDHAYPCCDYRDHGSDYCSCADHERSWLHPFGYPEAQPHPAEDARRVPGREGRE